MFMCKTLNLFQFRQMPKKRRSKSLEVLPTMEEEEMDLLVLDDEDVLEERPTGPPSHHTHTLTHQDTYAPTNPLDSPNTHTHTHLLPFIQSPTFHTPLIDTPQKLVQTSPQPNPDTHTPSKTNIHDILTQFDPYTPEKQKTTKTLIKRKEIDTNKNPLTITQPPQFRQVPIRITQDVRQHLHVPPLKHTYAQKTKTPPPTKHTTKTQHEYTYNQCPVCNFVNPQGYTGVCPPCKQRHTSTCTPITHTRKTLLPTPTQTFTPQPLMSLKLTPPIPQTTTRKTLLPTPTSPPLTQAPRRTLLPTPTTPPQPLTPLGKRCYHCKSTDHLYSACPTRPRDRFCFRCGAQGVDLVSCPYCPRRYEGGEDAPWAVDRMRDRSNRS